MTDRCEPPEHLRGVNGWHWVQWPEGPPQLLRWRYTPKMEAYGWVLRTYSATADGAANAGWRYVAPVATLEETATLRARVAELEAALIPFARYSKKFPEADANAPLTVFVSDIPRMGDCHAARAALEEKP